MATRPLTEKIPDYLRTYIVQQDPSLYTAIDHASWRYILKIARGFFAKHAHQKYLDGLAETGISTERIPLIGEMDACLRKFGWRTVAVSGFIPPAVFMEFLSRGILPIACDMRKLENLGYTPAPDIVHEAAGHAPIIADPGYAEYLRHYGELAEKAIYSSQDLDVYNAVRILSDVKENPRSTESEVNAAQARLDRASAAVDHVTEATQLGRMGWWTIEYGLLGDERDPKIYGAGLLSSVSESYHCLGKDVRKVPFTVECVEQNYDITKPQPQLFVARDFQALTEGLDRFAERMAYRRGGAEGLEKAKKARVPTTAELDSGLQISGTLVGYETGTGGEPVYLKFDGPTQLSFEGQELPGHGPDYHRQGFSTVLGPIRGLARTAAELTDADLAKLGFAHGGKGRMEFESGAVLEGLYKDEIARGGKRVVLSFTGCSIRKGSHVLFDPAWGDFDLACGGKVISVFGGAADRASYLANTGGFNQEPGKPKCNLTDSNRELNELYAELRKLREAGRPSPEALAKLHERLEATDATDWLLRFELLELDAALGLSSPWKSQARARLDSIARAAPDKAELISRGLALL